MLRAQLQHHPLLIVLLALAFAGCRNVEENKPYTPAIPANLGKYPAEPGYNKSTTQGVALGRLLFYDTRISANNKVSCGTCHSPAYGYADNEALTTKGVSGKPLVRNTPVLTNLAWMNGLFWDGGSKSLENLSLAPMRHPDEMAADLNKVTALLQLDEDYRERFKIVFGSDSVTPERIVQAMAQFLRTFVSANSPFDHFIRNEKGATLSPVATRGFHVFNVNCAICHSSDLFTDNLFHNVGLDAHITNTANQKAAFGRYRITQDSADIGKFKTPTLRNVMKSAPYMHDGRFKTIDEVFDFYDHGVRASGNLDVQMVQPDGRIGIPLSKQDREELKAFLETLTDEAFLNNPDLGNPHTK